MDDDAKDHCVHRVEIELRLRTGEYIETNVLRRAAFPFLTRSLTRMCAGIGFGEAGVRTDVAAVIHEELLIRRLARRHDCTLAFPAGAPHLNGWRDAEVAMVSIATQQSVSVVHETSLGGAFV
jgi:hypothetical protein